MEETTKTRVSREEIKEQLDSIKNATETIRLAVEQMKPCSARKDFCLTLKALEKKVAFYTAEPKERQKMTDEEKEMIKKFREGKIKFSEISTDDDNNRSDESVKSEKKELKKKNKKEE